MVDIIDDKVFDVLSEVFDRVPELTGDELTVEEFHRLSTGVINTLFQAYEVLADGFIIIPEQEQDASSAGTDRIDTMAYFLGAKTDTGGDS